MHDGLEAEPKGPRIVQVVLSDKDLDENLVLWHMWYYHGLANMAAPSFLAELREVDTARFRRLNRLETRGFWNAHWPCIP